MSDVGRICLLENINILFLFAVRGNYLISFNFKNLNNIYVSAHVCNEYICLKANSRCSCQSFSLWTNPVYHQSAVLFFSLHIFWKLAERLSDTRKTIIMLFLGCFDPELSVKATLTPLYKTAFSYTVLGEIWKYKSSSTLMIWMCSTLLMPESWEGDDRKIMPVCALSIRWLIDLIDEPGWSFACCVMGPNHRLINQ